MSSNNSQTSESQSSETSEQIPPIIAHAIDAVMEKGSVDDDKLKKMVMSLLFDYFNVNRKIDSDCNFASTISNKATKIHDEMGGSKDSALRQAIQINKHFIYGEIDRYLDDDEHEEESEAEEEPVTEDEAKVESQDSNSEVDNMSLA